MKKQPKITEKTRNAFVDAFCDVYRQKPLDKITVQEITRRSGYNRSTFYQYFYDIYALLDYVENDILACAQNIAPPNLIHGLFDDSLIHHIACLFDEKSHYLSALMGDYGSVHFSDKIKIGILSKMDMPALCSLNSALISYIQEYCVSTIVSMFRHWYRSGKTLPTEELVTLIHELLAKGMQGQMLRLPSKGKDESAGESDG